MGFTLDVDYARRTPSVAQLTRTLLSLTGLQLPAAARAGRPTVELLINRRAGTVGVGLASGVVTPAVTVASHRIGHQLLTAARLKPTPTGATRAVLADPITLSSVEYRPLPPSSALGLSAFYIALVTLDRKSTRLNSSHVRLSRMPSSA